MKRNALYVTILGKGPNKACHSPHLKGTWVSHQIWSGRRVHATLFAYPLAIIGRDKLTTFCLQPWSHWTMVIPVGETHASALPRIRQCNLSNLQCRSETPPQPSAGGILPGWKLRPPSPFLVETV
jgi:hypothetical protein